MSSSDSESSDEGTRSGEGDFDSLWLSAEEFDAPLPSLLGSSSRRRKTLDSLFPHLSDRVYRCQEFPHGVYINEYGEVCPDSPQSGIYKRDSPDEEDKEDEPLPDDADGDYNEEEEEDDEEDDEDEDEEENEEDEDHDGVVDEVDQYWEKEEQKVKTLSKVKGRKRRRNLSHDDEEDEDYVEMEGELLDSDEDDDWQPQTKRRKKNPSPESLTSSSSDGVIGGSDDEDVHDPLNPSEAKQARTQKFLAGLREAAENMNRMNQANERMQKLRVKQQKLMKKIETWTEDWSQARKEAQKEEKRQHQAKFPNPEKRPKLKNQTIRLKVNSFFHAKEGPSCEFVFQRPGKKSVKATAFMDVDLEVVVCDQCEVRTAYSNMFDLYDHMAQLHCTMSTDVPQTIEPLKPLSAGRSLPVPV